MKHNILLENAEVFYNNKLQKLNIGIRDGKFSYIGSSKPDATENINCSGLSILPGIIDSQVHFREPGLCHKEDIEYGSRGAAKGGVVAFFEMPNTKPPTVDEKTFQEKLRIGELRSYTDYAFYAGATKENIHNLDNLRKIPGCSGIKIFMGSSTGSLLLSEDEEIEKVLKKVNSPIAVHSEDEDFLEERKPILEEIKGVKAHPIWRSEEVALRSTKRILSLCQKWNKKVHLLHITTKAEAELLGRYKNYCTVEFTPQHLSLSAPEAYDQLGTFAQMNPPIRSREHTNALWKALAEGVADVFGSDHAPHTKLEKANEYPKSPSGMPGVQTLPAVLLTHVLNGKLPLEQFVKMTSSNVAKVFGLKDLGEIELGKRASLSFFDFKAKRRITHEWMENKSGWTPFHNFNAKAWPIHTMVGGQFALRDEHLQKINSKPVTFEHNHC